MPLQSEICFTRSKENHSAGWHIVSQSQTDQTFCGDATLLTDDWFKFTRNLNFPQSVCLDCAERALEKFTFLWNGERCWLFAHIASILCGNIASSQLSAKAKEVEALFRLDGNLREDFYRENGLDGPSRRLVLISAVEYPALRSALLEVPRASFKGFPEFLNSMYDVAKTPIVKEAPFDPRPALASETLATLATRVAEIDEGLVDSQQDIEKLLRKQKKLQDEREEVIQKLEAIWPVVTGATNRKPQSPPEKQGLLAPGPGPGPVEWCVFGAKDVYHTAINGETLCGRPLKNYPAVKMYTTVPRRKGVNLCPHCHRVASGREEKPTRIY